MATLPTNLDQARQQLKEARQKASPFVEKFARFGYAAKGIVYVVVGAIAGMAAIGARHGAAGSRGAMQTISRQPFGHVMLGVVACGLAGFGLWQFIRAIEDPESEGADGKGIGRRIGFFGSGLIYFGLVWYAIGVITGAARGGGGGGDDDADARTWSATIMSYPMGQWLVFLIGCGIVCYGVFQLVRAFRKHLGVPPRLGQLDPHTHRMVMVLGRIGVAARGIVFGIVGVFLAMAAYHHNPSEARGIAGALESLERQPYGPWLLGIVAVGVIAYGVYMLVLARHRRITQQA
jgi:hypothetical protein